MVLTVVVFIVAAYIFPLFFAFQTLAVAPKTGFYLFSFFWSKRLFTVLLRHFQPNYFGVRELFIDSYTNWDESKSDFSYYETCLLI